MLGESFKQYKFKSEFISGKEDSLVVERQGIPRSGTVYFHVHNGDKSMWSSMKSTKDLRYLANLLNAYADIFDKELPVEIVNENKEEKKLEELKKLFEQAVKILKNET